MRDIQESELEYTARIAREACEAAKKEPWRCANPAWASMSSFALPALVDAFYSMKSELSQLKAELSQLEYNEVKYRKFRYANKIRGHNFMAMVEFTGCAMIRHIGGDTHSEFIPVFPKLISTFGKDDDEAIRAAFHAFTSWLHVYAAEQHQFDKFVEFLHYKLAEKSDCYVDWPREISFPELDLIVVRLDKSEFTVTAF